jgi:hypothetical protein
MSDLHITDTDADDARLADAVLDAIGELCPCCAVRTLAHVIGLLIADAYAPDNATCVQALNDTTARATVSVDWYLRYRDRPADAELH